MGPYHAGVCKVYSLTDPTIETGEQVDCQVTAPCGVNHNGCVIYWKNGQKVANCTG
ncbi:hypothetical protein Vi05172_g11609 [Venturia inaequalis]|nr:hypothetical protein Vi05172_g11609 [Venturia inaequalis]